MKPTIFLIDAYNLIYRMFYAIPEMHTREGMQVNAIFGVAKFLKSLSEENPDAIVVIANDVWASFREKVFSDYKGTRDKMPDGLRAQINGVFELFSTAGIQVIGVTGYEADDIMGTISQKYKNSSYQVVIISSDKDLCQFVEDDRVHIFDAMKRKFMRRADVIQKFWVPPEAVRDYLAIVGDSSDNIPWIAGFWPKKAIDLLGRFHSLDGIYQNLWELTPKIREALEREKEMAFLSQKLATIITNVDIPEIIFEKLSDKIASAEYMQYLQKYEFRSLLPKEFSQNASQKIQISIKNIDSWEKYQNFLALALRCQAFFGIQIDANNTIFLALEGCVYTFDTKKIDCSDLIQNIFAWNIRIATFDDKKILSQLWKILSPVYFTNNSSQNSLF